MQLGPPTRQGLTARQPPAPQCTLHRVPAHRWCALLTAHCPLSTVPPLFPPPPRCPSAGPGSAPKLGAFCTLSLNLSPGTMRVSAAFCTSSHSHSLSMKSSLPVPLYRLSVWSAAQCVPRSTGPCWLRCLSPEYRIRVPFFVIFIRSLRRPLCRTRETCRPRRRFPGTRIKPTCRTRKTAPCPQSHIGARHAERP